MITSMWNTTQNDLARIWKMGRFRPIWRRPMRAIPNLLLMLICSAPAWPQGGTPQIVVMDGTPEIALPLALETFIQENFANFRVPEPSDHAGGWGGLASENRLPYAAWGDLDGDQRTDVALILISADSWRLFAFLQVAEGAYEAESLDRFPGPDSSYFQRPPQDFEISLLGAGESLILGGEAVADSSGELEGVVFSFVDSAKIGFLYRWNPGTSFFGITVFDLADE